MLNDDLKNTYPFFRCIPLWKDDLLKAENMKISSYNSLTIYSKF